MNRILILDNSTDREVYNPVEHWKPLLLFPFDAYAASSGEFPSSLDPYSHVLVTGSPVSILEEDNWMVSEQEIIRAAVGEGKVILGSCFGHQLIARSLFGKEVVRKREKPEIGWDITVIETDPLLGEAGRTLNALILHFDEVCNLPDDRAAVLARSSECDTLAFKVRGKPVWGIQPHPEIGIVESLKLIEILAGDQLPEPKYFLKASPSLPRDSGWVVALMREFQKVQPDSL